jgi:putative transposase
MGSVPIFPNLWSACFPMPRIARVVIPGIPHHITQRGNRRQNVFYSDADRREYLQLIFEYSVRAGLLILAYCLMTNHLHLIGIPTLAITLEKVFKPVHTRYAQHFNKIVGSCGRVWQSRFYSCPLDDDHLWQAIRYVERNPVRAGMVLRAEDYPWSSARVHCGFGSDPLLSILPEPRPSVTENWPAWLQDPDDENVIKMLRLCTRTGRPFGTDNFIAELEKRLDRQLKAFPRGRPAKKPIKSIGTSLNF